MSLTDKVIKNTLYYALSQIASMVLLFFLTPFIISKIGESQFGIYALVIGFTGSFGLLDLSLSSSFVKFISENYNRKEFERLNHTVNTGFLFYFVFSTLICSAGFLFTDKILSLINIPQDLYDIAKNAFYIALAVFFINNVFTIYASVLISIQKMFITSITSAVLGVFNFIFVIVLLSIGYGLTAILVIQLIVAALNSAVLFLYSLKFIPELKVSFKMFSRKSLKEMTSFGLQMQVSKVASFASEKYEEFLLAAFSVLSSVTYYNIAQRLIRLGKLIPFQFVVQVAPVAAEFKAKDENEKLQRLFTDTTKYLSLVSLPVFTYMFFFSDYMLEAWMGKDYEITVNIIRILSAASILNFILSAPGNSITPNIGIPKYQMYEGLIFLSVNLVASYFFIKMYGITGAAIGNGIAVVFASAFVFIASCRYFRQGILKTAIRNAGIPFISVLVSAVISLVLSNIFSLFLKFGTGRINGIVFLIITSLPFTAFYFLILLRFGFINDRDKKVISKLISKIIPAEKIIGYDYNPRREYKGELVSICVVTHNRKKMLEKCISSLLNSVGNINYELIIGDNNSTDGTREYLSSLKNERIKVIFNDKNIGTNAKAECVESAKGEFIIGIDDDVLEFPDNFFEKLITAYMKIPLAGYLASDVVQDDKTNGAKQPQEFYKSEVFGGLTLQIGPTGGWCFIISRKVYESVGKFYKNYNLVFFAEDGDFGIRALGKGYRVGIIEGLKVYHATGEYYNKEYKKIMDNKYADFAKGLPVAYRIRRKLSGYIDLKGYLRKLVKYAYDEN